MSSCDAELRAFWAEAIGRPVTSDCIGGGLGAKRLRQARFARRPGGVDCGVLIAVAPSQKHGHAIVMTRRSAALSSHPGEVSLPGGKREPRDPDLVATALREAREEIGLPEACVEVLGCLPELDTLTGYRLHPVVGFVPEGVRYSPQESEVAEIFFLPLRVALNARNYRPKRIQREGFGFDVAQLAFDGKIIWGATCGILYRLALSADKIAQSRGRGRPA